MGELQDGDRRDDDEAVALLRRADGRGVDRRAELKLAELLGEPEPER